MRRQSVWGTRIPYQRIFRKFDTIYKENPDQKINVLCL